MLSRRWISWGGKNVCEQIVERRTAANSIDADAVREILLAVNGLRAGRADWGTDRE